MQHGGAHAHPSQLGGPQVPHDRGVSQQEQRLGQQRAEGGDGQGEDLAGERTGVRGGGAHGDGVDPMLN